MVSETKIGRRIAKSGKGQTDTEKHGNQSWICEKKAAESMTLMCIAEDENQ